MKKDDLPEGGGDTEMQNLYYVGKDGTINKSRR
jgi:hypothetical protein